MKGLGRKEKDAAAIIGTNGLHCNPVIQIIFYHYGKGSVQTFYFFLYNSLDPGLFDTVSNGGSGELMLLQDENDGNTVRAGKRGVIVLDDRKPSLVFSKKYM